MQIYCIITCHDTEELVKLSDVIINIDDGKIILNITLRSRPVISALSVRIIHGVIGNVRILF